jgi:hypothetical protein
VLRAVPLWADLREIESAYKAAALLSKQTGYVWHVDHAVPLKHTLVCGLHCGANLQLLPGRLNASKGNRYWPDMPE